MFNELEFRATMIRNGFTQKALAGALGISERTLSRKIRNNGSFKYTEIVKLVELLRIEDPENIFFDAV